MAYRIINIFYVHDEGLCMLSRFYSTAVSDVQSYLLYGIWMLYSLQIAIPSTLLTVFVLTFSVATEIQSMVQDTKTKFEKER